MTRLTDTNLFIYANFIHDIEYKIVIVQVHPSLAIIHQHHKHEGFIK